MMPRVQNEKNNGKQTRRSTPQLPPETDVWARAVVTQLRFIKSPTTSASPQTLGALAGCGVQLCGHRGKTRPQDRLTLFSEKHVS